MDNKIGRILFLPPRRRKIVFAIIESFNDKTFLHLRNMQRFV